jgi:membrane-bound metal-dependent hydrolase YbcI (DUF457 family)
MPYAFFHIIFGWIFGKLFEFFNGRKLERFEWFLVLFGALLPDIDYLMEWTFGFRTHRLFTHSLLMLLFVFALFYFVFKAFSIFKDKNSLRYSFLLTMGVFAHLLLDFSLSPITGIPLFWPSTDFYGLFSGIQSYSQMMSIDYTAPILYFKLKLAILDMGLGISWVFYLLYSGKIKGF